MTETVDIMSDNKIQELLDNSKYVAAGLASFDYNKLSEDPEKIDSVTAAHFNVLEVMATSVFMQLQGYNLVNGRWTKE